MSSRWKNAWKDVPGINCGLCGRGLCSGFIRAFLSDLVEIDACPIYSVPKFKEAKDRLMKMKEDGPRITHRPAPPQPQNGILFTKPCKDTDEKVMAELRMSNGVTPGDIVKYMVFSPELLCNHLELMTHLFQTIKCSKDLGYARADYDEMSITFLNDGRINMRRVKDESEVKDLFRKIQLSILGSIVCNCCGSDMYSILAGLASPLEAETHTILNANLPIHLDKSFLESTGANAIIRKLNPLLEDINSVSNIFREIFDDCSAHVNVKSIRDMITNIETSIVETFDLSSSKKENDNAVSLLMLMSYSRMSCDSLDYLYSGNPENLKTIIESYNPLTYDSVSTIPINLIETYAHVVTIARSVSLLQNWLSQ